MILVMLACLVPKKETQKVIHDTSYEWKAPLEQEHSLVGEIWNVNRNSWSSYSEMIDDIHKKKHVFLGEKHDNPDHHYWQSKILKSINNDRVVAFEMLSSDQEPKNEISTFNRFADQVGWAQSGWPEFSIYASIFETAFENNVPIVFAHPPRKDVMQLMKEGANDEQRRWLDAGNTIADSEVENLREEIVASHCGHASGEMVDMMVNAQQFKDAYMAKSILNTERKSVLIAGTGHTRKAIGVPRFFNEDSVVVVHMVEVVPNQEEVDFYQQRADYLIFTPRMSNEDPCDLFRKQLEQMKK